MNADGRRTRSPPGRIREVSLLSRLARLFSGNTARSTAPPEPPAVPEAIQRLFDAQLATATRYEASGRYPGDVIHAIRSATLAAREAVTRTLATAPAASPKKLSQAIEAALPAWQERELDDDGYGAATFHELARDVREKDPFGND